MQRFKPITQIGIERC